MMATAPPTMPITAPPASPASMVVVGRLGKNVVAVNASDNSTRDHTITHATMFCRTVFTHGPSTARSLHSKTRNTGEGLHALGHQAQDVVGAERDRRRNREK